MNYFKATVHIHDFSLVYSYVYEKRTYNIQVPITDRNRHLKDGQTVQMLLGISEVFEYEVSDE